jgi:phage/plasmid-like protein (TIGR03299 family)
MLVRKSDGKLNFKFFIMQTIQNKVQEILTNNGLDFKIEKVPMFAHRPILALNEDAELVNDVDQVPTGYYGLYNTKSGNIINTVKDSYHVSQNDEIVELVLRGMEGFGDLSVSKAGSLNDGRRVFIQLGIDGFANVGSDKVKRYVTIIDSNDGSTGLSVGIGDLTMSCMNQFFYFYKTGQARMRHTASLETRILEIPNLIEMALSESMSMTENYQKFATVGVSDNDTHGMIEAIIGLSKKSSVKDLSEASTRTINRMESLYDIVRMEMAQKGHNVWGLHSGVTRWTTHENRAPKRDNGRIESSMVGTNYKTNQKSLEFAKQLARVY